MRKGIAINTILLLVVGLLVVGIIAYVVYNAFTGSGLSREDCRGRLISWCSSCSFSDYSDALTVGTSLSTACGTIYTEVDDEDTTCEDSEIFCSGFVPK